MLAYLVSRVPRRARGACVRRSTLIRRSKNISDNLKIPKIEKTGQAEFSLSLGLEISTRASSFPFPISCRQLVRIAAPQYRLIPQMPPGGQFIESMIPHKLCNFWIFHIHSPSRIVPASSARIAYHSSQSDCVAFAAC